MQDTEAIHKIQFGDEKAFESVFYIYYEQLCLYTYKYVQNSDDAEEIVQEMFVKFWNKRKNFLLILN